jgi:hypothetical protein
MQASKPFFFEKETFVSIAYAPPQRAAKVAKVFASFFKKKRFLALYALTPEVLLMPRGSCA